MKQQTLAMAADAQLGFEQHRKPTRRDEFLKTMDSLVPWAALCEEIALHYPKAGNGRPPIGLQRMLRTIIGAPSSTKNANKARDPEMHQTRKGQRWYFGMKLHIGVDSQTGLAHSAVVTAANVHDKHPLPDLLHGNEQRVDGDSAYASQKALIADKAPKARDFTNQRTRRAAEVDEVQRSKNRNKSRIRARVEHVFGVVKRLWGVGKVRYRGLQKNATRAFTALALATIYPARGRLLGQVRP